MTIRVLVGMETSGIVRQAFRAQGCDAWSCDLLPAQDGEAYHIQGDVLDAIDHDRHQWDLIIIHPTCTAMCVSGNHVYAAGKPRHKERLEAVRYTCDLFHACVAECDNVAMENPVGVLTTQTYKPLPKPQYIQPYEFGDDASKKTALFLWGDIQPLRPTKRVPGRMVNGRERWSNQTDSGQNRLTPSDDRWQLRSNTYPGIAAAMAEQWTQNIIRSKCNESAR